MSVVRYREIRSTESPRATFGKLIFYFTLSNTNSLHRRLARRGGVKRISATIYDDVRQALKSRLHDVCL
jgi:hypothetical protein